MIRLCSSSDLPAIYTIINDAAAAYRGVIPEDRWHEPYIPLEELKKEISRGVNFWGYLRNDALVGVMGTQDVKDVTLIRHAYIKPETQKHGIGTELLVHLKTLTRKPLLVGTWKAAGWAISFYTKNGFSLVSEKKKDILLKKYWTIPDRQIETSVVLVDEKWLSMSKQLH